MRLKRRYLLLGTTAVFGAVALGAIGLAQRPRGEPRALVTDPDMTDFAYVDGYIVSVRR